MYFSLAVLSTFAVAAFAQKADYPFPDVKFTSGIPSDKLCASSEMDFKWQGGSGLYTLVRVVKRPDVAVTSPETILLRVPDTTATVHVEGIDRFPEGTTVTYTVRDADNGLFADADGEAYDSTEALPVVGRC